MPATLGKLRFSPMLNTENNTSLGVSSPTAELFSVSPKGEVAKYIRIAYQARKKLFGDTLSASEDFVEARVNPTRAEVRRYEAELQKAALTVHRVFVPEELRVALWSCPQFAPWQAKIVRYRGENAKHIGYVVPVTTAMALSLMVNRWKRERVCRVSGWYFAHWTEILAGMGLLDKRSSLTQVLPLLAAELAEVGCTLVAKPAVKNVLCHAYDIQGIPEEVDALGFASDYEIIETPSRLTYPYPDKPPSEKFIARARLTLAAAAKRKAREKAKSQLEKIRKKNPARAERIELVNEQLPDMTREFREKLGQAIAVAEACAQPQTVRQLKKMTLVGVPFVGGRQDSKSTRVGGDVALGQLPSKVLRAFVGHTVELDITASTPSVAAALGGSRRVRRFFEGCAKWRLNPVEELARQAMRKCKMRPDERQLDHPAYRAALKAAKHILISALCGGSEYVQGTGPLEYQFEAGGKVYTNKVPGFRQAFRDLRVVRALLDGVWGHAGLGTQLYTMGLAACQNGTFLTMPLVTGETPRARMKRVRQTVAQAFCTYESKGIIAALRALQAQSLFRLVADKHDGLVLQRTRPKQLGVVELDVICKAAEGALRDAGVFTIMRLKYDADFGGAR